MNEYNLTKTIITVACTINTKCPTIVFHTEKKRQKSNKIILSFRTEFFEHPTRIIKLETLQILAR